MNDSGSLDKKFKALEDDQFYRLQYHGLDKSFKDFEADLDKIFEIHQKNVKNSVDRTFNYFLLLCVFVGVVCFGLLFII